MFIQKYLINIIIVQSNCFYIVINVQVVYNFFKL